MKRNAISLRRRHFVIAGLAGVAAPATILAGQCGGAPGNVPAVAGLYARGAGAGKLVVSGRILGVPECQPLAGATVEAWHADAQADRTSATTDADGRFVFTTAAPAAQPGRPPHIHYRVSHKGRVRATRQLYLAPGRGVAGEQVARLERDDTGVWRAAFGVTLA